MKILSIDAWRGDEGSWDWNNWYTVGNITREQLQGLNTTRKLLKWFRDEGYLSPESAGKIRVDEDGYNLCILEKSINRPIFAIETAGFEMEDTTCVSRKKGLNRPLLP